MTPTQTHPPDTWILSLVPEEKAGLYQSKLMAISLCQSRYWGRGHGTIRDHLEFLEYLVPPEKAEISLFRPDQKRLNVVGQKSVKLTYQEKPCSQNVYIIRGLKNNLLGFPAIKKLEMLSQYVQMRKILFHNILPCSQDWGHFPKSIQSN